MVRVSSEGKATNFNGNIMNMKEKYPDRTQNVYSYLWEREKCDRPSEGFHFENMQEVITEPIVRGSWGLDAGSGCGHDTHVMAKNNPAVKIVSMDISSGINSNLKLNQNLSNVYLVKGSVLSMPFKEGVFDFVYSYGVLHHTINPKNGLLEIERVLKNKSSVYLYLYEDHSENFVKYVAVGIINIVRGITIRIPSKILFALCTLLSPFVFIFFTVPSKILKWFRLTEEFSGKIPFNFGSSFFSLKGDLYDRFGAPIEHRFNQRDVIDMLKDCNFINTNITRLKATAGWVTWGCKKD